jgi:type IV pilus assembly protein PilV
MHLMRTVHPVRSRPAPDRAKPIYARGFTLIEILVTIAIILFGLLGVIALQTKASNVEFESYQRGQALSLARDMESRLAASRGIIDGYLNSAVSSTDGTVYMGNGTGAVNFVNGAGNCVPGAGVALAEAKYQACQWGLALQGAAETEGANRVGAMLGARGCLMRMEPPQLNALADIYIVVVWQGLAVGTDPATDSPAGQCASAVNFGTGLRRGVSVRVLVPNLTKPT